MSSGLTGDCVVMVVGESRTRPETRAWLVVCHLAPDDQLVHLFPDADYIGLLAGTYLRAAFPILSWSPAWFI